MKQLLYVVLLSAVAAISFAHSIPETTPKECSFGTPDYNETLCNETCTKEAYMSQPYCANFTKEVPSVPVPAAAKPAAPEVGPADSVPAKLPTEEVKDPEVPIMKNADIDSNLNSSGFSLESSIICSVSCLILSFCL